MTGYFFIGFIGGIALTIIVVAGMLHKLQNETNLYRKTIEICCEFRLNPRL